MGFATYEISPRHAVASLFAVLAGLGFRVASPFGILCAPELGHMGWILVYWLVTHGKFI